MVPFLREYPNKEVVVLIYEVHGSSVCPGHLKGKWAIGEQSLSEFRPSSKTVEA